MKTIITKINNLTKDVRNPRKADKNLHSLINLSIRKLGLLSPVYINSKGKILSGHQRTTSLKLFKYDEVVAAIVNQKKLDFNSTASINFLFNKVLQNLAHQEADVGQKDFDDLIEYLDSFEDLPDLLQPLKEMKMVDSNELIELNDLSGIEVCKASINLYKSCDAIVPLIVNTDGKVVNTLARLKAYSEMFNQVPVVYSDRATDQVFKVITASYSIEGAGLDVIRIGQRRHFIKPMLPFVYIALMPKKLYELGKPTLISNYLKEHFPKVLDFGSGNAKQTIKLRQQGCNITLFEPFSLSGDQQFSLLQTYNCIDTFLDSLNENKIFDAVVSNAVLNSVPTEGDLKHVITLIKFLASGSKVLSLSSRNTSSYDTAKNKSSALTLKGKNNSMISSGSKVKVQNFFDGDDLIRFFGEGRVKNKGHYTRIVIENPHYKVELKDLLEAVEFEFHLTYQNRKFDDLYEKAVEVFTKVWQSKYE